MKDIIPRSDADFNLWQIQFMLFLTPNVVLWGILESDFAELQALQAAWETAFAKGSALPTRSAADIQRKDDAREAYEKFLREFIAQWLARNKKVTNGDRQELGIRVPSGTRKPAPVPITNPVASVDYSKPLQHVLHYRDSSKESSTAKPEGVKGCEVYKYIGDVAPQDPSQFTYVTTDTRTPLVINFTKDDVGKMVHYILRWVNTRGEVGPYSNIVSAIVAPL